VFGLWTAQREVAGYYVRYALDAGYGCDRGERELTNKWEWGR
jgi:hypothetical protein